MITDITDYITEDISYLIVKGEIQMLRDNPWVRGFLTYIHENPKANAEDICRDLFCDNGKARKAAVSNILFFFLKEGLIFDDKRNGYLLTQEGVKASDTGNIWQGMKGAFMMVLWTPSEDYPPYIINIQAVPDNWYNNGKNELKDISEVCACKPGLFKVCSKTVKLKNIGNSCRPTYSETSYEAKIKSNGDVLIKGTPDEKTGMDSFEARFTIEKGLLDELFPDNEDEDF